MEETSQKYLQKEFERQVENLLQKGYAHKVKSFLKYITPLQAKINDLANLEVATKTGRIPFIIVVKDSLVDAESAMAFIEIKGQKGHVNMHPVTPASFDPIDNLSIPNDKTYLLLDIDTGHETLNVTPHDALKRMQEKNRSPLTIDEGVALVTHFPQVLTDKKTYNCFSMLGSRCGDQRVPALWISYKRPRLGWCWEKNPHTWLGSASCNGRIAP